MWTKAPTPDPPYIDLFLDQRSPHLKSNNIFFFLERLSPVPSMALFLTKPSILRWSDQHNVYSHLVTTTLDCFTLLTIGERHSQENWQSVSLTFKELSQWESNFSFAKSEWSLVLKFQLKGGSHLSQITHCQWRRGLFSTLKVIRKEFCCKHRKGFSAFLFAEGTQDSSQRKVINTIAVCLPAVQEAKICGDCCCYFLRTDNIKTQEFTLQALPNKRVWRSNRQEQNIKSTQISYGMV